MINIMDRFEEFKKTLIYKRKLKNIEEKALSNPENFIFQVRIGDFLMRLRKRKEAIGIYERAAQRFIEKRHFAQAIALKKIIFRLEPPHDKAEQNITSSAAYKGRNNRSMG